MKVAILTLPVHTNYGGILQAYALQTVLERMGHEVNVLHKDISHRFEPMPRWKWPLSVSKRIILRLMGRKVDIFPESRSHQRARIERFNRDFHIVAQHTNAFAQKYIHLHRIESLHDLRQSDYDAYVVGSDQIWRQIYFQWNWRTEMRNAFLDFTEGWNVRRIAYAASFGVGHWEIDDTAASANAAKQFDKISVREDSGIKLCKEHLGVEAELTLDPTLLLSQEDYSALTNASQTTPFPNKLTAYILDLNPEIENKVKTVADMMGLAPTYTNNPNVDLNDLSVDVKDCIQPPVESWLRSLTDAKFVITDSFHACVFSIIFNKPFAALGNKDRGNARFESLLKLFGLEERLVRDVDDIKKLPDVDWLLVNEKLSELKARSLAFLDGL